MNHISSLLLGIGNGGVFAALGVALVITFRSSRVLNFATGAIALFVAYTYAGLRNGELLVIIPGLPETVDLGTELPLLPAIALSLVVAALLGALLYAAVFRPLRNAPPLAQAVASLGVLIVLQAVLAVRVGTQPVTVASIFPAERWELGEAAVLSDRAYMAMTIIGLTVALTAAYRFTRFGLVTRAAAESQVGAMVSGISPDRVALLNWMVSAAVAGMAGILIAPLTPLTPVTYTLFVIPALAAAVVGRFEALIPTALAGLVIGMLQSEAVSLTGQYDWMPYTGSPELVPLIIILLALIVIGHGIPARGQLIRQQLGRAPLPRSLVVPTLAGLAVGVAALLLTDGTWRAAIIASFIFAIIGLSLVVVTGYAGQVSLAQLALAGAAAFTLSGLTESWGVPFPFAPLLAALAATVIGVVVGLPALRLRGLNLGVVTLALAYAMERVWFSNTEIVGTSGASISPPSFLGLDLGVGSGEAFPRMEFGLLCLITLVAVAVGVAKLRTSTLGSAMLAVRANERSAAGVGVDVVRVKLASFAIASFIAGIGGSLLAYRQGVVSQSSFTAIGGLALLSTAYLAGITSVWGGINAGIIASSGIVFIALDRWVELGTWFEVISGALLIVTLIAHPEGVASIGHAIAERLPWLGRSASPPVPATTERAADTLAGAPAPTAIGTALAVEGLTVRYGGVRAVGDVSLEIEHGKIIGLIGPNGAGKTSVIDAITGFAPSTGSVQLAGQRLDNLSPHQRVRAGLGRTFQSLELYDSLSVIENVRVAAFGVSHADRDQQVAAALELVGITELANRPAGELSQGQRQLVSIARAYVADPKVLLLDEPAAGLDSSESTWLGDRIRDLRATGTGILLVDHDVSLVLDVCDHIYVLNFGVVIADGPPADILASTAVADAYLGTMPETAEVTA